MGMIIESQLLDATQTTNALLGQLLTETRRTNQLLEWLGSLVQSTATADPQAPKPPA